jgi:hypothetical protein
MLTILNDSHIGAIRGAGTTPVTQWQLRQHLLATFASHLPAGSDLMLLGDLFDTNNVPVHDVLKTYLILVDWLTANPHATLWLVAGNHDLSKTSTILSSFEFLCSLLQKFSPRVYVVMEPRECPWGYIIPHLPNQDLFDLALSEMPPSRTLFVHCNYDNNFAAQADQSLNLSKLALERLPVEQVIVAHEHHKRKVGKVYIPGNQMASSVSDWLSESDKFYTTLEIGGEPQFVKCADRSTEFVQMNWKELQVTDHLFVRVNGDATPEEATSALNAVNKLRARHPALVVTNGINMLSEDNAAAISASLDEVAAFNIWETLEAYLEPAEFTVVQTVNGRVSNAQATQTD